MRWDTAINSAISFATNTDWQSYQNETTTSYLTKMLGLSLQNFLSAAIGMAVAVAFIRGFIRKATYELGNCWVILTRSILYVLLPLSIILSLLLVSQGVVQNLHSYTEAHTIEGKTQIIAQGPAASQVAIKHLGTNGGGFFNTNSAHPFENPTPLSDYLEILSILVIAAAFPFTFGAMLGSRRQGLAIFMTMVFLYLLGLGFVLWSESHGNPILEKIGIHQGISMEGKEVRLGHLSSAVFANSTTATSAGATNSAHDSLTPIAGMVLMFNMAVGEVIFGGVGSGFIGMLLYAILTMFLIGLMIGRAPEIYGKKLEPLEMVMAMIALFLPEIIKLIFGAIYVATNIGVNSIGNPGPHGLSEIIYAVSSAAGNNGSAFNGLHSNNIFYNLTLGFAMLIGRLVIIVPPLAIAGSLILKKINPPSARFPTATPTFVIILAIMVVLIGFLSFLPILVLGPILEHLFILAHKIL
jgi:potassium-transporting ATPase potassium-binding subunit